MKGLLNKIKLNARTAKLMCGSAIAASTAARDLSLPISKPTIVPGRKVCPLSAIKGILFSSILLPLLISKSGGYVSAAAHASPIMQIHIPVLRPEQYL